jgi:hypothetical protein
LNEKKAPPNKAGLFDVAKAGSGNINAEIRFIATVVSFAIGNFQVGANRESPTRHIRKSGAKDDFGRSSAIRDVPNKCEKVGGPFEGSVLPD